MFARPGEIASAFKAFQREPRVAPGNPASVEAKAAEPKKVTARLNYSIVGVCPYCDAPMGRVTCCDQEVFLCETDRFVSPIPNEELP